MSYAKYGKREKADQKGSGVILEKILCLPASLIGAVLSPYSGDMTLSSGRRRYSTAFFLSEVVPPREKSTPCIKISLAAVAVKYSVGRRLPPESLVALSTFPIPFLRQS